MVHRTGRHRTAQASQTEHSTAQQSQIDQSTAEQSTAQHSALTCNGSISLQLTLCIQFLEGQQNLICLLGLQVGLLGSCPHCCFLHSEELILFQFTECSASLAALQSSLHHLPI